MITVYLYCLSLVCHFPLHLFQIQTTYPVNDEKNSNLYKKYKELALQEKNVIFGGRLGEYKYYDMDKTIEAALDRCRNEFGE